MDNAKLVRGVKRQRGEVLSRITARTRLLILNRPGKLAEVATRLSINIFSCVNAAAQHAGVAALTGPQESVHRMVATFAQRRDVLVEALNRLPGVRCVLPDGAFYAFPNITTSGFSARELQDRWLDELGVATIAGTSFGALGEGYVRLSYASSLDNIREAMRRIDCWLQQHGAPRRRTS